MKHPGAGLRAVIFDLDGTLVDTADDFVPAVQQLRREHALAPMAPERIRASVSNGSRGLVRLALGTHENDPQLEVQRQRLLTLYGELLGRYARLYPGIAALLEELAARKIAWGIATNKPRAFTLPLLETLSLRAGSVICPDDVQEPKPHPESLHKACDELGCQTAEAIYLGDHARDVEAGRRAGMYTIACAYGYIEPGDSANAWGANSIATQSEAIRPLLFEAS